MRLYDIQQSPLIDLKSKGWTLFWQACNLLKEQRLSNFKDLVLCQECWIIYQTKSATSHSFSQEHKSSLLSFKEWYCSGEENFINIASTNSKLVESHNPQGKESTKIMIYIPRALKNVLFREFINWLEQNGRQPHWCYAPFAKLPPETSQNNESRALQIHRALNMKTPATFTAKINTNDFIGAFNQSIQRPQSLLLQDKLHVDQTKIGIILDRQIQNISVTPTANTSTTIKLCFWNVCYLQSQQKFDTVFNLLSCLDMDFGILVETWHNKPLIHYNWSFFHTPVNNKGGVVTIQSNSTKWFTTMACLLGQNVVLQKLEHFYIPNLTITLIGIYISPQVKAPSSTSREIEKLIYPYIHNTKYYFVAGDANACSAHLKKYFNENDMQEVHFDLSETKLLGPGIDFIFSNLDVQYSSAIETTISDHCLYYCEAKLPAENHYQESQ